MSIQITDEIRKYWGEFIDQNDRLGHLKEFRFKAWSFGNTREMANELGKLVVENKKTATCSLLRAYQGDEDEIPQVGVYSVLCDGDDKPICIIFLTHTWICKYSEVSAKHAYEEGEGDRSLEYWKKAHYSFFSQYEGFHEEDELICERFRIAYR